MQSMWSQGGDQGFKPTLLNLPSSVADVPNHRRSYSGIIEMEHFDLSQLKL